MTAAIMLPGYVTYVMDRLEAAGYETYVVGGCVRDCLLGREPGDWDVTTNAKPDQIVACFSGHKVIPTGIQHGTVSVVADGKLVEITTYRVDGDYSDHRRPDSVTFTDTVAGDLARRDFTVNALAYHPKKGVVDHFGGLHDLARRRIVCVGNPTDRFREDALRILRGARFACVLGFQLEEKTREAMLELLPLLSHVAAERIATELNKAVVGKYFGQVFRETPQVLTHILPELAPCVDLDHHNPYHIYDVWEHTLRAVDAAPTDRVLRLTMLLHDTGKPATMTLDERGRGSCRGHEAVSEALARGALERLRYDNATIQRVCLLIRWHDVEIPPEPKYIKRWLNRLGEETFRQLLAVQRADNATKAPQRAQAKLAQVEALGKALEELLAGGACYSLKDLGVSGADLMELGIPRGPEVGRVLAALLDSVIDGTVENEREALLTRAGTMIRR